VLAQELATVDAMTDGRLEIGIGAGWNRPEFEAAGIPFDPPADRVRRMRATFRMLRQALSEGRIDHEADAAYPAIHQADLPTSVQRPHPPFMIGGGGPKLLSFAAREAEIIGIDPRSLPDGGGDSTDITARPSTERSAGSGRRPPTDGSSWRSASSSGRWTRSSGPGPARHHPADTGSARRSCP
jgi:alkanesulfonate monooxygenase SsuD/methylene tetrahydromethanopterin reductase-like flavin-dependent oxidoreductase (luciferase family)